MYLAIGRRPRGRFYFFSALIENSTSSSGVARLSFARHWATICGWQRIDGGAAKAARSDHGILFCELARLDPLANDLGDQVVDAVDVLVDDMPVALEGDDDHLMHLFLVEHRLDGQAVLLMHVAAQTVRSADRQLRGRTGHLVDGAEHAAADRLMDLHLRGKEAVDVGRRHAEIAGDVGDVGLGIAVVAEQPLGRIEDAPDIFLPGGIHWVFGDVHSFQALDLRLTIFNFRHS